MSCERCGGFKVFDYFYGTATCDGFRCINCGAITDMRVILPPRTPERTSRVRPKSRPSALTDVATAHPSETGG